MRDADAQIDLDTTLAQAEVLFLSFRSLVQEATAGSAGSAGESSGLRRRVGASGEAADAVAGQSAGAGKDAEASRRAELEDLRELVRGWGDAAEGANDLESGVADMAL
jgi:hypothetical protein